MSEVRGMTGRQAVACALLFLGVGLAVGWHSLNYEWHFDDLHLVRTYSAREIAGAFTGTWDPDGVETRGLRPLTLLFNDVRARIFGERVVGHRLFLLTLFSAYLTGLGSLACRIGAPWRVAAGAGVLTLCAKNSFYHFLWISDGIHLVPALFFVGAAHALLTYLDGGRTVVAVVSAVLMLLALAAREDALALYAVVVLVGFAHLRFRARPLDAYWRLVRYGALLFCTFLPFWIWRLLVVPRAPNFRANLAVVTNPFLIFRWTIDLAGQAAVSRPLFEVGFLGLLAIAWFLPRDDRRRAWLWLALAALTCVPGAVVARANLLLFPVSFYAFFVASTLVAYVGTSRRRTSAVIGVLVIALLASKDASQLEQLSMHAMSADKIFHDWFGVYSKDRFASIPPARLRRTKASLARFGIVDDTFDFVRWERDLEQRNRIGFIDDGEAFVPARRFMSP
jgi:hypothetical protein